MIICVLCFFLLVVVVCVCGWVDLGIFCVVVFHVYANMCVGKFVSLCVCGGVVGVCLLCGFGVVVCCMTVIH